MAFPIYQVDAFTHIPYRGNPAAVLILDKMKPSDWMQKVAAEMNLSETAFVAPNVDPFKRVWQLKWFTPATEVELCGHATIATAHVLFSEGYVKPNEPARFDTLSGELSAIKNTGSWIELNFPTSSLQDITVPAEQVEAAIGTKPVAIKKASFDQEFDWLIELPSSQAVRDFKVDVTAIAKLGGRGVCITSQGGAEDNGKPDFVSRFFAPNVGVDEDPVTGSAHCYLSAYWAKKLNKTELTAHQVSSRGGTLKITLDGKRTKISGRAVTIFKGNLLK
ncbi:MAG: PhzF family phenazine biosynthesis protein [Chloroflexota bacterium]